MAHTVEIGDRIVAAVAQDPFVSGGNWFCTLTPICDLEGRTLSDDEFPNRGLIWWRVIEAVREYAVRRNLIIVELEPAPAYDAQDPQKDYYQVGNVQPIRNHLNEIIDVPEHEDSDALIRAGRVHLDRVVSGPVYFRTGEDVSGPWKITGEETHGFREVSIVKPLQNERIWRWKWEDFQKRVRVIHRDVRIVIDWHWNRFESASYTLVFQEDLKTAFEHANLTDAISDRDVLSKVARATVGHTERRQIEKFFENGMVASETIEELRHLRPRMEQIAQNLKEYEDTLDPLLDTRLERDEIKPLLERRKQELAEEYVRERREELEARVHQEIRELVAQRDKLQEEIQKEREAFEDERRRQQAQLEKEREDHRRELEARNEELEQRQKAAIKLLEKTCQRYTEHRSEFLEQFLGLLPLLREIGAVPPGGLVGGGGAETARVPTRKREHELPPFVLEGVPEEPVKETEFVERWLRQCHESGYSYTDSDLLNFHVAMKSERFNILAGPSGVGKSTLPRLYSHALHGSADDSKAPDRYLLIPVRPGWMDTRDLLGYFNSLEGFFEPSPSRLFQFLIYACEEEKNGNAGIYTINLDEINLSYVEHYFADFLSALQSPEGQQGIQCFYPELCREDDPFRKYGYLPIARSVRFVGTANIDETTKPFSPRLLDRVNVVELQIPSVLSQLGVEPEPLGRSFLQSTQQQPIAASVYRSWTVYRPSDAIRAEVHRAIEPIQKVLVQYGYPISPRVLGAIVRYVANAHEILSTKEAIDRQVLQRVLPRLRGHTERFREMLQELLMQLPEADFPRSHQRLAQMAESEYAMDFFHCLQES